MALSAVRSELLGPAPQKLLHFLVLIPRKRGVTVRRDTVSAIRVKRDKSILLIVHSWNKRGVVLREEVPAQDDAKASPQVERWETATVWWQHPSVKRKAER